MIAELKLQFGGDGVLLLFDGGVDELFHFAAVQAHDVVVMCAFV
jgi:hypothetical protein